MSAATQRKPTKDAGDAAGFSERKDRTPIILQALGIGRKEWQYITKEQLLSLNRPGQPEHVRVWAVGMMHSIAYGRECAVRQVPVEKVKRWMEPVGEGTWTDSNTGEVRGSYKLIPLGTKDIGDLTRPKMDKASVNRAIDRLEREGIAKQENYTKGKVRFTFWVKPRKALEKTGSNLDSQNEESDENRVLTPREATIALKARIRKRYFPGMPQKTAVISEDLVGYLDYQKGIEEDAAASYQVGLLDFQKRSAERTRVWNENHTGVKSGRVYKEEKTIQKDKTAKEHSSIPETKSSSSPVSEEEDFQTFKTHYPPHRLDEVKARAIFNKLSRDEKALAISRLRTVYLGCPRWMDQGGKWIPFASNFLRDCHFEADPPPLFSKASREEQVAEQAAQDRALIEEAKRKGAAK